MRKGVLVLVCILLFLVTAGAGAAWLWLSPEGAMRTDLPESVMEAYIEEKSPAFWREEYLTQIQLPVTEFEDGPAILGRLYDAAAGSAVTFSPLSAESGGDVRCYLVCLGEAELFRAVVRYRDKTWQVTELTALKNLGAETHTVSVLLPSDASLSLNGVPVGEEYLRQRELNYPDMSPLELQLAGHPTRKQYVVDGLCEAPAVEARREGGLILLSAADGAWEYTLPDAAGYSFAVSAPREAEVYLGDHRLGEESVAATSLYTTALDIPDQLQGYLPAYVTYTGGGLYALPAISARLPDGTELTGSESGGVLTFAQPGTDALREQQHELAETFIRALTTYGSGNGAIGQVSNYVSARSPVQDYLSGALDSLHWTHYVTLSFQDVTADSFIPLGEGAYLCRCRAAFTTKTWYQTRELCWDFEMLWRNEDGYWRLWDLAFL